MKLAIQFVVALAFFFVGASNVLAQPVGQTVDSLQWRCARSSAIVRGFVQDFRVPADQAAITYNPEFEFTIKVTETIKGPDQPNIVFRHLYDKRAIFDLEKAKANKTVFLLFVDKSENPKLIAESYPGTFPVPAPEFKVRYWSNGKPIDFDSEDHYVQSLKQAVAENAKYDIQRSHKFEYGDFFSVLIPFDKRAEALAKKILREKAASSDRILYGGGREGASAVGLLAEFWSQENEVIVRDMLKDSTDQWTRKRYVRTKKGYDTTKIYTTRQAAFDALLNWGIAVEKPVMQETFSGPRIAKSEVDLVNEIEKNPRCRAGFTNLRNDEIFVDNIHFQDTQKLPDLSALSKLKLVYYSGETLDISGIGNPESLSTLHIDGPIVGSIESLSKLENLENLWMVGGGFVELPPFSKSAQIQRLNISKSKVSDLRPLANLSKLNSLTISNTEVTELGPLSQLSNLEALVAERTQVSDLTPLNGLAKLKLLKLNRTKVQDISPLAGCTNLQELELKNTNVGDLSPLSQTHKLETLAISHSNVADLQPLSGIISMRRISADNSKVTDVGCLANLTNLEYLQISKDLEIKGLELLNGLQLKRRRLRIYRQ